MRNNKVQDRDIEKLINEERIKRLAELSTTERHSTNQEKAKIKEQLLNAGDVTSAIKLLVTCYTEYSDAVISNNIADAKSMLATKKYHDGVLVKAYEPESEEYKEIKKQTYKKYWSEICKTNGAYFEELLKAGTINDELKTEEYKRLVDFATENTDASIDGLQKNKAEINHLRGRYKDLIEKIDPAFSVFMRLYLATDNDKNDYAYVTSVLARALRRAPDKLEMRAFFGEEYKAPTGKKLAYAYALAEIIGNLATVRYGVIDNDTTASEQPGNQQREIIPRIAYDTEMQIAHSEYITTLIKNGFQLDKSIFNKSEETLKSLKSEDNEILDLLILNWYAQGVRRFTDRQIAVAMYHGGNSNADVSAEELRKINESIDRLRKTDIKKGLESVEEIDSSKLKVTETTTLISVIIREIEHNGNTTVYDFTGVQGYDEYAQITKKTSRYSNALITADIKGIQHDFKNDTLKRLLTRRITGLNFRKHTAIDMREVYEVLEITDPRKYTYAKKKVKAMLEELRNDKNDIYYNFSYEFKKRNKATIVTFTASTSNPLEVNETKEKSKIF